jgi:hypothetical protein
MNKVCAWCGMAMGTVAGAAGTESRTTHAICDPCRRRLSAHTAVPLPELLETLSAPVLLAVRDERGVAAVVEARAADTTGLVPGEVFECVHARDPDRCEYAVHCCGCVIRQSVDHTYRTGAPTTRIPATLDHGTDEPDGRIRFHVSTERIGHRVLLLIEPLS